EFYQTLSQPGVPGRHHHNRRAAAAHAAHEQLNFEFCQRPKRALTGGKTTMTLLRTTALAVFMAGSVVMAGAAIAQDKTFTIGVSVPTADHGWTGGLDFFAQQAIDRLQKAYPNVKFVRATAPDSTKQAADLDDMLATRNIDGLVILPGD